MLELGFDLISVVRGMNFIHFYEWVPFCKNHLPKDRSIVSISGFYFAQTDNLRARSVKIGHFSRLNTEKKLVQYQNAQKQQKCHFQTNQCVDHAVGYCTEHAIGFHRRLKMKSGFLRVVVIALCA